MYRFVGAALTIVATAGAVATTAAAKLPTRTFEVTVEGVQTTRFSVSHAPTSQCDQSQSGSGSEHVVFASSHPQRMVAHRFPRNVVAFDTGVPGFDEVPVVARITRTRHVVSGALDPRCEGTGGAGVPAAEPDCGTRREHFGAFVGWWPLGPGVGITLGPGIDSPARDPFRNCQINGVSFPQLLQSTSTDRHIVALIPPADLFDPKLGKHVVIARGRFTSHSAAGSAHSTSIRWTVSLTATK